ncbi:MoxR family ATPase [Anabaena cylindrica UHCC 0172]|uniref:AAA family ATPase n=1 Tax=Anabaena cylindrica TaxID=1165 RepID=UPI002B1F1AC5|nr:MoxR family ATPase [Anabaena cylindrica]MEA5553294.1 MoxR family ATPase [Anabaena cylindrica UHCC 0172]
MNKKQEIKYQYIGDSQPPQSGAKDPKERVYYPYLPSPDLIEAVNLAIALERPLLLEGEPGCGKTRLAGAVAYEFTKKYLQNDKNKQRQQNPENKQSEEKWWDYYIWNIKSTTRARDGLYSYDAIARLRDAQLIGTNLNEVQNFLEDGEIEQLRTRLKDKKNYRKLAALGQSLTEHSHRPILLIDEIDKADSDFANDLLLELDQLRFEIPETREDFPTPKNKPIIFITSNREKPLPEPFLRRCLYFFVNFPEQKHLKNIIKQRFGELAENQELLVTKAIERFYDIRSKIENVPGSRPPGTSEFIEFLTALLNREDVEKALKDLEDLSNRLPLLGILLKTKQDQELYSQNKRP